MKLKRNLFISPLCFIINMAMVYIVYEICRLVFLAVNWSMFSDALTWQAFGEMLVGGWFFDTSAILYTNALYALMMLFPIHYKESSLYQKVAKWVFVVVNALSIVANLTDCVYFQYTTRRTTVTVFSEFKNENNLGGIFGVEILRHWYLVLIGVALIAALWYFYRMPKGECPETVKRPYRLKPMVRYYVVQTVCLLVFVPFCVAGMRGGFTTAVRPITISNANQYVERPQEAAIVLNTPFSLIRTIDKPIFEVPNYYTEKQLDAIYSPIHHPSDTLVKRKKNVVVIIIESFGREYIGGFNKWLDGGKYKGYTPFVDSLMQHSATYLYSYCNGRKSIDGMPSILSSIPMFVEPFFLTPASMNNVSGLAGELKKEGYDPHPEIMVPLTGILYEFEAQEKVIRNTAAQLFKEEGVEVPFKVGTMIEIPRAALTADRIASRAEYFSFGTNDLTQMTFGYSRDDIASFLPVYLEKKILKVDPFQVLDQNGVGQLVEMAVEKGRSVRPELKCGICGEHGGEPSSVKFCHRVGLDYVSCSPFRVPIARLAAAQAAIEEA